VVSENEVIGQITNNTYNDFKFVKNLDKFDEDPKPQYPMVIGDPQPSYPLSIAIDSYDDLYVLDSESTVQKFDNNGNFVSKWGGYGTENGKLNNPQDFAIDSNDNIYIADSYNRKIQKFDRDGKFIDGWDVYSLLAATPNSIVIDNKDRIRVGFSYTGESQYFDVYGNEISINSDDELKDFESENGHLSVINSTGYRFVINDDYESNDYNKIQIFAPVSEHSNSFNSDDKYLKPFLSGNRDNELNIDSRENDTKNKTNIQENLEGITDVL
jgi:hypothetical protein